MFSSCAWMLATSSVWLLFKYVMLSLGLKKLVIWVFVICFKKKKKINVNVFGAFFHEWGLQPSCVCVILLITGWYRSTLVLPNDMGMERSETALLGLSFGFAYVWVHLGCWIFWSFGGHTTHAVPKMVGGGEEGHMDQCLTFTLESCCLVHSSIAGCGDTLVFRELNSPGYMPLLGDFELLCGDSVIQQWLANHYYIGLRKFVRVCSVSAQGHP